MQSCYDVDIERTMDGFFNLDVMGVDSVLRQTEQSEVKLGR